MLTRVTITGADDAVDPESLATLSDDFPFVEWGILFSGSRAGTARYPTLAWVDRLLAVARREHRSTIAGQPRAMTLAAHFCGEYMRDIEHGMVALGHEGAFGRVQLNGVAVPCNVSGVLWAYLFERVTAQHPETEFIMQIRSAEELPEFAALAALFSNVSALFDPSAGQGVETTTWPRPPTGLRLGFAGGIKPSTVGSVLAEIGPRDEDFWIDMESGVRTDDKFDLGLVREVLAATRDFVSG